MTRDIKQLIERGRAYYANADDPQLVDELIDALERLTQPVGVETAIHQWRKKGTWQWADGHPDLEDGSGPYETRTLYTAPPSEDSVFRLAVLKLIKDLVCGDRHPNWSSDSSTYATRGRIADLCDATMQKVQSCNHNCNQGRNCTCK